MKAMVIAEQVDAARNLCSGARKQFEEITLIAFGDGDWRSLADTCFHINVPEDRIYDDAYLTINRLVDEQQPDIVYIDSTVRMVSLAGRLAAHLETSLMTDVISIDGDTSTSLYFGGAGIRTVRTDVKPLLITVSSGFFADEGTAGTDAVMEVEMDAPAVAVTLKGATKTAKSSVNLSDSEVIVGVGRGFGSKEDLNLASQLCDKIGAEMGCSRPLTEGVDWMPRETYIGVSGLMLAPKTYVACGISGQVQHMVGVNRAGTIFAINKDKGAPIFSQCDYGLIGEVEKVLPEIIAAL